MIHHKYNRVIDCSPHQMPGDVVVLASTHVADMTFSPKIKPRVKMMEKQKKACQENLLIQVTIF